MSILSICNTFNYCRKTQMLIYSISVTCCAKYKFHVVCKRTHHLIGTWLKHGFFNITNMESGFHATHAFIQLQAT